MDTLLGLLFGIAALLGFGVQDYYLAVASRRLGALRASLWFQVLAAALLLFLSVFFFTYTGMSPYIIGLLVLTALISVIGLVSFSKGLQVGNVSIVVTVSSAWGMVTAILGFLLLKESITALQALSIVLIIIGTVVVSYQKSPEHRGKRAEKSLGIGYALLTLACWGLFFFLVSVIVGSIGWFSAALFTDLLTPLLMLCYGKFAGSKLAIKRSDLPLLAVVAVLNIIAFLAYNLGVSYNYTAIVAPISAASPIVVVALAVLLLKEKLTKNQAVGIALVLVGLIALSF